MNNQTPSQPQRLFNTVSNHLLAQQAVSLYKHVCAYRGANGLQCAVGCLITDEYYSPSLEHLGATNCLVREAVEKSLNEQLEESSLELMKQLQGYHDGVSTEFDYNADLKTNGVTTNLNKIAEHFGLEPIS